ncbi:protein toll-like [Dreissena polymorpha]|uniref:TIR domain-containing protein n=1 Tax=Dreissena polymorpha TaxID=45954 RepID=A0A9D4QN13_DREPO|nr:protein toll-like [Dreissena polymorpha]KAH3837043.1 hypothetical protein DPMN_110421 [Dreissena polymorpha]
MACISLPRLICLCLLLLLCVLGDANVFYWQPDDKGLLDLSNGKFTSEYIDNATFTPQNTNTSAVLELNLANNTIKRVDPSSFVHLFNLRVLRLARNAISELSNETFVALRKLETLDVSHNRLKELLAGLLSLLTLKEVHFNNNNISYVEPGIVGQINQELIAFHLEHNALTYLDPWMYETYSSNNRDVDRKFYLEHNRIRTLTNFMNWTYNLKYPFEVMVELQYNEIQTIHSETVLQYRPNTTTSDFSIYATFLTFYMNVSNNPFHCDCKSFDMANILRGTFLRYKDVEKYRYRCSSPSEYGGWDWLHDLPLDRLVCRKNGSDGCPTGCLCEDRPHNDTYFVNCTGAGLIELPQIPTNNASKIELFLDDNFIQTLSNVSYLERVYNISLRNNRISILEPEILKQLVTAKKVDLRNNKLKSVPREIKKFESVSISGNPLECDCDSMWLKQWMEIDTANADPSLSCEAPTGSQVVVMEMTLKALGCTNDLIIMVASILAVVLAVLVIGIVFAVRCPYETKVLLFRLLRVDISKRYAVDKARERNIDVYLVFDETDADITGYIHLFIHKLNKKKPIYSVFNPKRYMEPGSCTDNISKMMGKSKRVVVLLSKSIFDNSICMEEIDDGERRIIEAETINNGNKTRDHNEALQEIPVNENEFDMENIQETNDRLRNHRNEEESLKHAPKVIYIIYNKDEILAEKLKEEPWKTRLEGKTVLRPDPEDRLFWSKLRYELPRKGQGEYRPPFASENVTGNTQPLALRARPQVIAPINRTSPTPNIYNLLAKRMGATVAGPSTRIHTTRASAIIPTNIRDVRAPASRLCDSTLSTGNITILDAGPSETSPFRHLNQTNCASSTGSPDISGRDSLLLDRATKIEFSRHFRKQPLLQNLKF